ncbi:MAG: PorP/SprF family type IX secretion system membrane protein [Bacteroidota bacterium]
MKVGSLAIFLVFNLILFASKAQQGFAIGYYMLNPSYFNAAWLGVEEEAFATAHYRSQWTGYEATVDNGGAPSTQMLSFGVPVRSVLSGLGITVVNDRLGIQNNVQVRLAASVSRSLGSGRLSFGIMPGFNVIGFDPGFRAADDDDPFIPLAGVSETRPNLHAGLMYQTRRNVNIGISAENIFEPSFDFGTDAQNELARLYSGFLVTDVGLLRDVILRPSILARTDLTTMTFDMSALVIFENRLWGGLSYKRGDALGVLFGYSFLADRSLSLGYSFDYIIQNQEAKQSTSNEIYVRYNLPDLVLGGRKAVKTPRFTF